MPEEHHLTRRAALGAMLVAPFAAPALASRGDWVNLGSRTVSLLKDRDILYVGLAKGLFTGLRLEVSGGAVFMERLSVRFSNDESVELPVRRYIEAGGKTRDMLFPSLVRAIRHVDLIYRRVPGGGTARITVYGRQA